MRERLVFQICIGLKLVVEVIVLSFGWEICCEIVRVIISPFLLMLLYCSLD